MTGPAYSTAAVAAFGQTLSAGYGVSSGAVPSSATALTIEARVTIAAAPTGNKVAAGAGSLGWVGVNNAGQAIANFGGFNSAQTGVASQTLNSNVVITDGATHTLREAFSNTGAQFWVDGNLVASSSTANNISTTLNPFGVRDLGGSAGSFTWPGTVDEVAIWTGSVTPSAGVPTSPYAGTETGLVTLYHVDGNANDAVSLPVAAIDTGNVLYSPAMWKVSGGQAITVSPGAYFKTVVVGGSATLNFNTAGLISPVPQITMVVDDQTISVANVASTVSVPISGLNAWSKHTLEVIVKSVNHTSGVSGWNGTDTGVILTGITLGTGGTLSAPAAAPLTGMAFGDSITNGTKTLMGTGTDLTNDDSRLAASMLLRRNLGAEIGNVGWSSAGYVQPGSVSVPAFSSSWPNLYSGQVRTLPALDFVVVNGGTNDFRNNIAAATLTPAITSSLNWLIANTTCPIFVVKPLFSGGGYPAPAMTTAQYNAGITAYQAGMAATTNPNRLIWINTDGLFDGTSSYDGLHPYGDVNAQKIAPFLAAAIKAGIAPARSYTYR